MSSLKKLNGLQMGGAGEEGFPDGSIFQTKYGIPPSEFGRIIGIKTSYIMWNNHTNKNKFDEFWNKVYLKYSEAKKTNPNLKLKDYTEKYLESIPLPTETPSRGRKIEKKETATTRNASRSRPRITANRSVSRGSQNTYDIRSEIPKDIVVFLKANRPNSIFDKLIQREPEINSRTTNTDLIDFIKKKYNDEFAPVFGQGNYSLFQRTLERWRDYPVPIPFTTFLEYYVYYFSQWKTAINANVNEFDIYYEIFYSNELIPTWEFVLEKEKGKDIEFQLKEFDEYIMDFIEFTREEMKKRNPRKRKQTKTPKQAQTQAQTSYPPPPQQSSVAQGCATREPPQYNEVAVKIYNKLINCLDVGKDATATDKRLDVNTHGSFMLDNVIDPLFNYNSLDDTLKDIFNFKGVGDKSEKLFNQITNYTSPNIEYVPIIKDIRFTSQYTPEAHVVSLRDRIPGLILPPNFYVIADAGYAPTNILTSYIDLFTFATILDTASPTVERNRLDLTNIPTYTIKPEIISKYSLDTAIDSIAYNKYGDGYHIQFTKLDGSTIDEYFNASYKPMNANRVQLDNRASKSSSPIDVRTLPPFYSQGNYNKNFYIQSNYQDGTKMGAIHNLVFIKEMGDTLKVLLLDHLLSYTDETLEAYPTLKHTNDTLLPFCRENCVLTTNDSNLAARCLLNRINSIVSSGRNVIKNDVGREIAGPLYRIETDAEIRARIDYLKAKKINELYEQNKLVVNLLIEIANTGAVNVYFEDKTINQKQKELLSKAIDVAQKQNPSDPDIPLFQKDLTDEDPENIRLRRKLLCCVLLYMAYCLSFINEKIKDIFMAYTIGDDEGHNIEDIYRSFLSEVAKFRFELPFEKYVDNTNNVSYVYSPNNEHNKFCFLPKLYGLSPIENDYGKYITVLEPADFYYYAKDKYKYKDFSLPYYFKIKDFNKFYKTDFGTAGIGSLYRILNNRIENGNFVGDQVNGIISGPNNEFYLIITPSLYSEIVMDYNYKNNIFHKCVKTFCIDDIIYDIGWGERFSLGNKTWIQNNDPDYIKQINKLFQFSSILEPTDFMNNCIAGGIYDPREKILQNFNSKLDIRDLKSINKGGIVEAFGPFRKDNIIEDTLIFDNVTDYSSTDIAMQSYLNKEIAEFINSLVEGLIVKINTNFPKLMDEKLYNQKNSPTKTMVETLHKIMTNLTYDLKTDLQKKLVSYIGQKVSINAPSPTTIVLKNVDIISNADDNYKGRVDDTSLDIDIWSTISLNSVSIIQKGDGLAVKIGNTLLSNIFKTVKQSYRNIIDNFYSQISQNIPTSMIGGDENTDPSTIENNSKLVIDFPPFNSKLTNIDPSMFNSTIFQKYFQNIDPASQKPGLLTFHMLCYFPKVIFMVYSLLKYIEHEADLQTSYNASYKPLKNILIKFYERDFSDQLNRIFHDIVGDRVDPTYDEQEDFTIADLTTYDNATAVIIDIAQQMYNVAGLFKVGEEQFKADLALFNTHVLKMEPGDLFLKISEKKNKHDIEYLYGRLFDAEYYVCDTKGGLEEEFNSIRVFEKFLTNGVYSYGVEAEAETSTIEDTIMKQAETETNVPQKVAPGAPKKEDVGFLAKMLDTLGLGKEEEEEEEPMPVRKLNYENYRMNENPTPLIAQTAGKKTKKRGASKKYKKTRKVRKHNK